MKSADFGGKPKVMGKSVAIVAVGPNPGRTPIAASWCTGCGSNDQRKHGWCKHEIRKQKPKAYRPCNHEAVCVPVPDFRLAAVTIGNE